MKRRWLLLLVCAVVASIAALHSRAAFADANGAGGGGAGASATDGGADADADADAAGGSDSSAAATPVALACDGSLCDTTNGSACTVSSRIGGTSTDPVNLTNGLAILAIAITRRRTRREECQS